MTTVSAVVPTFNRADTLGRALASVFTQTRPPDEVLVVDDASTDGTEAVVRLFPRAQLVRLSRNGGAARARNEGIGRARGELIAFLDSDDLWANDKLRLQLARFETSTDLLCTGVTVHERGGRVGVHTPRGPRSPAGWSFADFQAYPFAPSTWLIRRAIFTEEGLFDEAMRNCEDLDFLARIAHRRIRWMPEALTTKFNRADSLDAALDRTVQSYGILFERHERLWARAPAAAARGYRRLAHMHINANDTIAAREALLRALRHWPGDLRSWVMLALSPFGISGYRALRRLLRPWSR